MKVKIYVFVISVETIIIYIYHYINCATVPLTVFLKKVPPSQMFLRVLNTPLDYHTKARYFFSKISFFTMHKKLSFSLRISSVNVTKSAGSIGFGHIYGRNR